jgi:hypothetical protein
MGLHQVGNIWDVDLFVMTWLSCSRLPREAKAAQ